MLNPIKTIGLIGVLLCLAISPSNCACPTKGKVGGKAVPDVLSLIKNQNGFSAAIEIFTPEESLMVTEKYNVAKKYGSIDIDTISQGSTESHYYYTATNERFVIKNDKCESSDPTWDSKQLTVDAWLWTGLAKIVHDFYGKMDYLGPTSLMIWARSVSDKAQYVGTESLDGVNTDHWYYCLFSGGLEIDWWFDSSTAMPFRFRFNNTRSIEVFNFLQFEPLQTSENDLLTYPIGYDCHRRAEGRRIPAIPKIFSEDTFSVEMEARIMYTNPDKVLVSSNRMTKYQKIYSFEITDEPNSTRIIQHPNHLGNYIVNAETGECKSELFRYSQTNKDNLAATWPYSQSVGFNLMNAIFADAGYYSSYMGQVSTDSGVMDVWEENLGHFFSKDGSNDVLVTYYFPAIDRTQNPNQAPSKIVLKPINKESISVSQPMPDKIEIIFIDYQTDKIKLSDQFDVTGCYDGSDQFKWFQIVVPDPEAENRPKSLVNTIRDYFKEQLATFIPVIRTPEMIINLYDSEYYVTVKLLERPSFDFLYPEEGKFKITNPTLVLTKDNLEDCADVCIDMNCYSISYCSDSTCQVFNYNATSIKSIRYDLDDQCSYHEIVTIDPDETIVERNVRASTNAIFNQIKEKVDAGEFVIPGYALTANKFFMVNGPEEVGGLEINS